MSRGGDRARGLRPPPRSGGDRESVRRTHPVLRVQVRLSNPAARAVSRRDPDVGRSRAAIAPHRRTRGARSGRRGGPAGRLPPERGLGIMSAGRRLLRLGLLLAALLMAVAVYLFQLLEHPSEPASPSEVTLFFPF